MPDRWNEREGAIMNGIMSLLVNECDALACVKKAMRDESRASAGSEREEAAARRRDAAAALYDVVAGKVRPTLRVCADEFARTSAELAEARGRISALRSAVETVIANQHAAPRDNAVVLRALSDAAPGHPNLPRGR